MKIRSLIAALGFVGVCMLSSCRGGYTCPTYMKNTEDAKPVMAKQVKTQEAKA